jgi:hypothetical protein
VDWPLSGGWISLEEATAGHRSGVGDALAKVVKPAVVPFQDADSRNRFYEAAQLFVGVGGSFAAALVQLGRGAGELSGNGFDGAAVFWALADGSVVGLAHLGSPRRNDHLSQQAGDVCGDAGRGRPARRPLE